MVQSWRLSTQIVPVPGAARITVTPHKVVCAGSSSRHQDEIDISNSAPLFSFSSFAISKILLWRLSRSLVGQLLSLQRSLCSGGKTVVVERKARSATDDVVSWYRINGYPDIRKIRRTRCMCIRRSRRCCCGRTCSSAKSSFLAAARSKETAVAEEE